jgi:hypothetical protein
MDSEGYRSSARMTGTGLPSKSLDESVFRNLICRAMFD